MNECEHEAIGDTKKNAENETKKVRWTQKPLIRQVMVSSCMDAVAFQMGLYLGACPVLVAQLRAEPFADGIVIDDEKSSWISSMGAFSGIPCVLLVALMGECFGRRPSYLFMSVVTCASFGIFYCSTSFKMLILALSLQGPLLGGSSIVCLLFGSECVAPKYRGLFMCVHSATIFWGIWMGNAVGTFFHWKNIGIIGIVSAVYSTLIMYLCPESPFWLASKGKIKKCREAHRWLRGTDESDESELKCLIRSEMERSRKIEEDKTLYQKLLFYVKKIQSTQFYQPMGLCILVTIMFHLSGKYVLSVYAIDILKKITNNERAAYTGMLMLDGITVLGMYIGSGVSKYTKRRTLFFSSEFVAISFLFVLSLYLYLIKLSLIDENVYLSISLLLIFSLCLSCGAMTVITPILSELMPLEMRTLAAIIQCVVANITGGIMLKIAPWVFSTCGTHGSFLFFGIASFVCAMILFKYLPETSNKTLEQIESCFKEKDKSKEMKESVPLSEPTCALEENLVTEY